MYSNKNRFIRIRRPRPRILSGNTDYPANYIKTIDPEGFSGPIILVANAMAYKAFTCKANELFRLAALFL